MRRRDFNKLLGGAIGATGILGFPAIVKAVNAKPTLRVLGTHVTLQEEIRQRAEQDLGFNIRFYPGGSAEILNRASIDPESFDVYEQWSNSIRVLWQADAIKAIATDKIRYWQEINSLSKLGRLQPSDKIGKGDAPHTILYVQKDKSLGPRQTPQISYLPYVHNTDSFGYNSSYIEESTPYQGESWAWLLNDDFAGKVAIVNEPTIGLFDLALACEAKGLIRFSDIGNITRYELDELFAIIKDYQLRGHFRGVWNSVPESIHLMKTQQVHIQSMFSPAVSTLNGAGVPCIYAAPREGYRAWLGVMCLSSRVDSEREDMAYQFMNWWLSGWAGAFIARQGYYISNPERSRPLMSGAEWDYWYEGKPAAENLLGTHGNIAVAKGQSRRGGSYATRFANVSVWNTVMDTYEYSLLKWNDFLTR